MANRSYPHDAIGNEIRKGDLVRVSLRESALNFRVQEVQPAGTIASPELGGVAMRGLMVLTATMPVEFDADGGVPMMVGMLVLKEPEKPTTTQ